MFNLKSDLKIYTCDKYLMAQKVITQATKIGDKYRFQVNASITQVSNQYDKDRYYDAMQFTPAGMNPKAFREFLELGGISLSSIEGIGNFNHWAKANPDKTWSDFARGVSANLELSAEKLDAAFAKIRPDALMNDLALSPDSRLAQLIGKSRNRGYRGRSRRASTDRENQLVRLWALYGNEVAISASSAALESVLNGIQLHDFGISHCETMQIFLNIVEKLKKTDEAIELVNQIKELDIFIAKIGGKPITRVRPRSPYFAQVYDSLKGIQAA